MTDTKTIGFRVPTYQRELLDEIAANQNKTVSDIMRGLVKSYLEMHARMGLYTNVRSEVE